MSNNIDDHDEKEEGRYDDVKVRKFLQEAAINAMQASYSPYSKIKVGAAIQTKNGKTIFTGTNIENASYGLTICAERVALFKAVSAGHRKFARILIVSDYGELYPCGMCRQALAEFSPDMEVIISNTDTDIHSSFSNLLSTLLPMHFNLSKRTMKEKGIDFNIE